jgi:hypothetical protein
MAASSVVLGDLKCIIPANKNFTSKFKYGRRTHSKEGLKPYKTG